MGRGGQGGVYPILSQCSALLCNAQVQIRASNKRTNTVCKQVCDAQILLVRNKRRRGGGRKKPPLQSKLGLDELASQYF